MTLRFDPKTPTDVDSYTLDFTAWLASQPGDAIVSAAVTTTPAGLTMIGQAVISAGAVSQQLAGGAAGTDYTLFYAVGTASGRFDTRAAKLLCALDPALLPAGGIVSQLGARALRKLGVAIVADAARPGEGATMTSAQVAAGVLLNLGLPVAEAARPGSLGIVSQTDLAGRALRAVGIDPSALGLGTPSGITFAGPALATAALLKLAVIASDETPPANDQAEALARVSDVHDMLNGLDYVTWALAAVPAAVAEMYIVMTANLLAPQFGKPASMDAFNAAQAMIRQQALSGVYGQALAETKVSEVHDALNALGLVSWTVAAVPTAQAQAYVQMAAVLLAPVMRPVAEVPNEQASRAAWDGAVSDVRKASVIAGAQARAQAKVEAVQAELNDLGLVSWDPEVIPAAVADAVQAMAAAQLAPEFGREFDPKAYQLNQTRIRQISMGGPAGQALAEQKVLAVHYSLEARGRTRWTIYDLPVWGEEPYVLMAAVLLAPECGVKADPNWTQQAEMDLMRIVSLPSTREPVRAMYF
jgi:hypothetical protein